MGSTRAAAEKVKGRFTFRTAAILFALSALFEILSPTAVVPLLGSLRGGVAALICHLVYAALYAGLAIGIWQAKHWGYNLVMVTTAVYTLDKLQFLLFRRSILDALLARPGSLHDVLSIVDPNLLLEVMTAATLVVTACWWGFAAYAHFRRHYFSKR